MARITLGTERFDSEASESEYRGLETGDILFFPGSPPLLPEVDRSFLVTQKQVDASYHKNISYRPTRGPPQGRRPERRQHSVHGSTRSCAAIPNVRSDSCRLSCGNTQPAGRSTTRAFGRSRNQAGRFRSIPGTTCLHFDSFPTRPSHGDRLLRIFTNIHPERARVWITTDHFEALAGQFADRIGLHNKPGALETCKQSDRACRGRLGLASGRPSSV